MQARFFSLAKVVLVWFCLISWVEASNYCAISTLLRQAQKKDCCTAKPSTGTGGVCCQILQAVDQGSIKADVVFSPGCLLESAALVECGWPVAEAETAGVIHYGDPPPANGCGVIDLQRCHPAFAPPLV